MEFLAALHPAAQVSYIVMGGLVAITFLWCILHS
jgi:hypothetical protein